MAVSESAHAAKTACASKSKAVGLAPREVARAVAQDVRVGVLHGPQQSSGHDAALHAQLRVDARHDDIEALE